MHYLLRVDCAVTICEEHLQWQSYFLKLREHIHVITDTGPQKSSKLQFRIFFFVPLLKWRIPYIKKLLLPHFLSEIAERGKIATCKWTKANFEYFLTQWYMGLGDHTLVFPSKALGEYQLRKLARDKSEQSY